MKAQSFCLRRAAEIVTATAAEVIKTRTPVAYAPACASTLALNNTVIRKVTAVNSVTKGRVAFAQ